MRHPFRRALGLCILLVLPAAGCGGRQATKDDTPCFLWKVSSAKNTVYLLGSVHAGKKEFYPLPAAIEDAFAKAHALVVEIDPTKLDPVMAAKIINTTGSYPAGQSLSKSVSKKTLEQLTKYCAGKGTPVAALERFKPWTVTLLLTVGELKATGFSEEFGIDKHFLDKAKKANKPVHELETAAEQIKLFADLSPELQEQMLAKTLTDLSKLKEIMDTTWAAWQAGDASRMENELLAPYRKDPEFGPFIAKTFDERNLKMTEKLERFLEAGEPYFVVVGAGHLIGEKGILQLLEGNKYKVEQIRRGS